jgi:hypothetical protein
MVKVGDRIRLSSTKGPGREGVVMALTGSLVQVRWQSGEETTVIPAPGTLTVLAVGKAVPEKRPRKGAVKTRAGAKNVASESATPKKKSAARRTKGSRR